MHLKNPPFLIIGSMKSGTTSIYEDMTRHSRIYASPIKEPGDLTRDEVLSEPGLERYAALFQKADPGQWIGEATTQYTAYPHYPGVPFRARSVFGPELKLIFVGRDPIERLRSHYRHEVQKGTITCSLADLDLSSSELVDISRYDFQLEQWLAHFPDENLLVLRMEDYLGDPQRFVHKIWTFLGLEPEPMAHGVKTNVSAGKREPRGIVRAIVRSRLYGLYVRDLLPRPIRKRMRELIVPTRTVTFEDKLPPIKLELLQNQFSARLFDEMAVQFDPASLNSCDHGR